MPIWIKGSIQEFYLTYSDIFVNLSGNYAGIMRKIIKHIQVAGIYVSVQFVADQTVHTCFWLARRCLLKLFIVTESIF